MSLIVRAPASEHEALRGVFGRRQRTALSDFVKPARAELIHDAGNLRP
jgi:hypothetical protein